MAYTVEGLRKIDGYNDNVRVGFKEGGHSVEQVNLLKICQKNYSSPSLLLNFVHQNSAEKNMDI